MGECFNFWKDQFKSEECFMEAKKEKDNKKMLK
jgi:hypothetical protein